MIATNTNRLNCLNGEDFDSENTKYLVMVKLTTTPRKKEIEKERI